MKKFIRRITLPASSIMILAACGGDEETAQENGEDEANNTSEEMDIDEDSRTLTIALGTDIIGFDIHDHNNTSTEAVHVNMFDYLVKRNVDTGEMEPELAEEWELVDDTTWEFTLRDDVTFHNGDPLTAEDVKFSLERAATDDTLQDHSNYRQIKEVEVIDDHNFKIITHDPEPALLNRISRIGSGILPADYIDEEGWEHFNNNPIGSGEFEFVEWSRDDQIVMEPYSDYYQGENEEWDEVVFRVIPENSTRVSELLTGGIDIASNVPPNEWERVEDNDQTSLKSETSNRTLMFFLRHTEGYPTSDPRVREAIDLAIDNEAITENVLGGAGTPTKTRVAPGNFGFHEDLYDDYNYDPERAQELLDEAGYGDGVEITLHSPRGRYLQDAEIAEMAAGMLSAVGIQVNVDFVEWSNFVDMRTAGENEDMYLLGLGNSMFDAANALDWYRSEDFEGETDYVNEEVDRLLDEAENNMDEEEREAQYQEVQEIVTEDVAHIVLHQESINLGVNDRIEFEPTMDEMFYVDMINRN